MAQLGETLLYRLEGRGFDSRWCCSEGLRQLFNLRDFHFIFAYCSERNSVTRGFSLSLVSLEGTWELQVSGLA